MFTLQIQKVENAFCATLRENDAILSQAEFEDGEAAQEWGLEKLGECFDEQADRIAELTVRLWAKH